MRITLSRAFIASTFCILLLIPRQSQAWGNSGHESVAYAAWQQMTPATRTRAIELLKLVPTLHDPADSTKTIAGYDDWVNALPAGLTSAQQSLYLFMRAATWADSIKHEWLTDSDTPPPGRTTEVHIGFTDTESHGYWHFVDNGFASDTTTVPPTPTPNAATQITALRDFIASNEDDTLKAYDLIWLEHLVGDIHQPLHGSDRYFAGTDDEGGNIVKIKLSATMKKYFDGTLSKSAPTELHAYWDDLPGEGSAAAALAQAATYAKSLPKAVSSSVAETGSEGWGLESLDLAEKDAYMTPIGVGPKPADGTSSYVITTAYFTNSKSIAQQRIALAGARLAKLLNENLK
jgi:hypothetical protein